jgi:hypothetical protein
MSGAKQIALGGIEFAFLGVLEVSGLRFDKEAVDGGAISIGENAQVDAEPDKRKQVHRFARIKQVAILHDAVSAPDFVEQFAGISFEEFFAGVEFVLDDGLENAGEALKDFFFGFT